MALEFTFGAGEELQLNTLNLTSASCTMMMWVRVATWQSAYEAFATLAAGAASNDPHIWLGQNNSGNIGFDTADGTETTVLTSPTNGSWYHVAASNPSGGTATAYARVQGGSSYSTQTLAADDVTPNRLIIANDNFGEPLAGAVIGFIKVFNRALSATEIFNESHSIGPVSPDCTVCRPMFTEADYDVDLAGNGTAWTTVGLEAGDIIDSVEQPLEVSWEIPIAGLAGAGEPPPGGSGTGDPGGVNYDTTISNLSADHHWALEANSNDQIGSVNGTDTSITYTSSAIAETATNAASGNAVGDRISLPTTTNINNSAQTRKAVAGWFAVDSFQTPPTSIYGEGNNATAFRFILAYGNNVMLEVVEPTNFTIQVYSEVAFAIDRPYHLCGIFEGNGFGNEVRFYIDGVEQTRAVPTDRQPDTADLNLRGVGEFMDPAGTVGVGGDVVILVGPTVSRYNHWATWDGAVAVLSDANVRELFEDGALTRTGILAGTEAAMQISLDTLADTAYDNVPLDLRIAANTGDTSFTLTADNITHDPLTSIHVQYMGTETLTWRNLNGSNASIGSTPNGGTIVFVTVTTLTITVLDASDGTTPVQGARVRMIAATGGPLTAGTVILNEVTNASGVVTTEFDFTANQPFTLRARQGTSAPFYKPADSSGTIIASGLTSNVFMVSDE